MFFYIWGQQGWRCLCVVETKVQQRDGSAHAPTVRHIYARQDPSRAVGEDIEEKTYSIIKEELNSNP